MRRRTFLLTALGAVLAGLGVGAALFPLSLALSLSGAPLEGEARGRVWNGVIKDARIAGTDLGTVRLRPRLLPLLRGTLAAPFEVDGPSGQGRGAATLSGAAVVLERYDGTLTLSALGARDPFGRPLSGTAEIDARGLHLTEAGCQAGTLTVSTDALTEAARALGAAPAAPRLAGEGACADGVLTLPLSGEGPSGRAAVDLRVAGRRYTTEVTLDPTDPRAAQALTALGFQRTANGYNLITRGAF